MPFDNMPLKDSVTERIERAIACLEERGWCQRHMSTGDGRVCLIGAFEFSGGCWENDDVTLAAVRRVNRVAGLEMDYVGWDPEHPLVRWNDSLPALTGKQTVLGVLRRAAAEGLP